MAISPLTSSDFSRMKRLARSTVPKVDWSDIYDFILEMERYRPPRTGLSSFIEMGLLERGWDPSLPTSLSRDLNQDTNLNKGQKQVQTLIERLQKSGQKVPEPEDAGREGIIGKILNALGATGGAVTTLIYDLINRDGQVNPIRSLREGFTGKHRKIGSDILAELGVQNKAGKAVGGFVLDVLLDPLSYVGIGAAAHVGTNVARRIARDALKKAGREVSEKELDTIIQRAIGPKSRWSYTTRNKDIATVARAFGRPVEEITEKGRTVYRLSDAQPFIPRQYNLEVGVPFTPLRTNVADITPLIDRAKNALARLPESTNPVFRSIGRLGEKVSTYSAHLFRQYPLPSSVANLFHQRDYRINSEYRNVLQLAEKLDKSLGGGYRRNPVLHDAVVYLIDEPTVGRQLLQRLTPDQRKMAEQAANQVRQIFKQIEQREVKLGILPENKVREFYFTHLVRGDRDALQAAREMLDRVKTTRLKTSSRYQRSRSFDTLRELEEFVRRFNETYQGPGRLEVVKDVGQVVATRKLASEVLIQNKKLINNIKNLGDEFVRPAKKAGFDPNFTKIPDVPELNGYVVRKDVADFINEWNQITVPGKLNGLVKIIDGTIRIWKGLVTTSTTHYVNNIIGAIWNNWLMGVRNVGDYQRAAKLLGIGKGKSIEPNLDAIRSVKINLPDGTELNGEQILSLAKQFNVIRAGSEVDFIERSLDKAGNQSVLRKIASAPQRLDEFLDDHARLAGFIHQLRQTGDPYMSALNVKKHLFDYNELSKTEKQFFSRIIPFYAWLRKNIPLQIVSLIRKPGMYTGAEHAIEEGARAVGIDIEDTPGYIANAITIPLFRKSDGNIVYASPYALPANDLFEFLGALEDPVEFGKYLLNQIAPWYRLVPEIAANENFFTGAPIDKKAEETGTSPDTGVIMRHILQQTGLPARVYQQLTDDGSDRTTQSIGFGLREYNPDYYQENVLPYQYAGQLRRTVQDLTESGQTVYTKLEIDQAEKLGLTPEQVRILHRILEQQGERRTKENVRKLYYLLQMQGGLP